MTVKYEHLENIPYIPGVNDCFEVGRSFFKDNFGIEITPYARPHDWSSDNLDLIRLLYEREGFEMLADWKPKDIRPGDVFCLAINESNPNHFAIYVGDNKMLHHLAGRRSVVEPYRDFWRNSTCFILRHPDVPDLRPVYPNTSIGELLRERYRVQSA